MEGRTTQGVALRWVVQQQQLTAAAGKDVVPAYFNTMTDAVFIVHAAFITPISYLCPCIDVAFSAVGLFELQLAFCFVFVLSDFYSALMCGQ